MPIPGAILGAALCLVIDPQLLDHVPASIADVNAQLTGPASAVWVVLVATLLAIAILLTYALAIFLGTIVAILAGFFEYHVLDRYQAVALNIPYAEYWKHWERYLEHLETAENPYISGVVEVFQFALRSTLGTLALFFVLFTLPRFSWRIYVPVALFAAFLAWTSVHTHRTLARYRRGRFSAPDSDVLDGDELLRRLVSKWCAREALDPLRSMLPYWPARADFQSNKDLCDAIDRTRALGGIAILESERETLLRAHAVFHERANRLAPAGAGTAKVTGT